METHPQGHPSWWNGEQWLVCPWQGAAAEGHPKRSGASIGPLGDPFHRVETLTRFGSGSSHFVNGKPSGNPPALFLVIRTCTRNVVGHRHDAHIEPISPKSFGTLGEMEDIAGIVAKGQKESATAFNGLAHPMHLSGRGRGKDVAAGRSSG